MRQNNPVRGLHYPKLEQSGSRPVTPKRDRPIAPMLSSMKRHYTSPKCLPRHSGPLSSDPCAPLRNHFGGRVSGTPSLSQASGSFTKDYGKRGCTLTLEDESSTWSLDLFELYWRRSFWIYREREPVVFGTEVEEEAPGSVSARVGAMSGSSSGFRTERAGPPTHPRQTTPIAIDTTPRPHFSSPSFGYAQHYGVEVVDPHLTFTF